MDQINCISCSTSVSSESVFCYKCGSRIKCQSCDAVLLGGANFCAKCGTKVGAITENPSDGKNTVKYRRTKDEVFCEVSLSDEVGKEGINGLIQNLTNSHNQKMLNAAKDSQDLDGKNEFIEANIVDLEKPAEVLDKSPERVEDIPHISDIEMNLNCTEGEWMLIYAYYESNFGKNTFSKQSVYDKYMFKRKTPARAKNFAAYWKGLFKHYLATVNENELKFKSDKLPEMRELILGQRKSSAKIGNKGNSKKKSSKDLDREVNAEKEATSKTTAKKSGINSTTYSLVTTLNLIPKNKQSVKDFCAQYKLGNNPENILKMVYYLERVIQERNINENMIYTCYKHLSLPVPNIRQTLNNIHSRNGWINTADFSDLKVTVAGENYIEHNMEKI